MVHNVTTTGGWNGTFEFARIGLVLSGGGAKGVYQAGSMKAIHEFLQSRGALKSVCSVAGASIGSWNALFWLAGSVDPSSGVNGKSPHELWWTQTSLREIFRPAVGIVPGLNGHLMSNGPWRDSFERLFGQSAGGAHERLVRVLANRSKPHYYISRTNVLPGRLAFDTNNPEVLQAIDPRKRNY